MASPSASGTLLDSLGLKPEEQAAQIGQMWMDFNTSRNRALSMGEETRQYIFATDVDTTSAAVIPHKNRTHQPKLTEISDNLQSQYHDATISSPEWFVFEGEDREDRSKARTVEGWIKKKLEWKRFRETTGREIIADYVHYGNCFAEVDYIEEFDDFGAPLYRGAAIRRISPLDIVFNAQAESFYKSPKIIRRQVHVSDLMGYPSLYPDSNYDEQNIKKAMRSRQGDVLNDWIQRLKERGLDMDGYATMADYFKSDMVELLIYRGNIWNPKTEQIQTNRVITVVDRAHVIRNEANRAPLGFDGLHNAGWRLRNDNRWCQGPLDNLVGMQYRIDHLENLKADVFDLIAWPPIKIKGEGVIEPENGFGPGATYQMGIDEDVEIMKLDAQALNADNQIQIYHQLMETFAGAPIQSRGVRTPGEKTAFEVDKLETNSTKIFVDKAKNLEAMLERMLMEFFYVCLKNFDGVEKLTMFDDVTEAEEVASLNIENIRARGNFIALGSKHWSKRNKELQELAQIQQGPLQDPAIKAHINGFQLAKYLEKRLGWEEEGIIEEFAGIREQVQAQFVAQEEQQKLKQGTQEEANDEQRKLAGGAQSPDQLDPELAAQAEGIFGSSEEFLSDTRGLEEAAGAAQEQLAASGVPQGLPQ